MTNNNKTIDTKNSNSVTKNSYSKVKVRFVKNEANVFSIHDLKDDNVYESFINAFGTKDIDIANRLMNCLSFTLGSSETKEKDLDFAIAYLQDFGAKDTTEAMLAIQMLGTTLKATNCIGKANLPNQSFEGETENINRATKLNRTYIAQMDALKKYRSKGSQKITVEHINVNDGGKAVIGSTINNQINNKDAAGGA